VKDSQISIPESIRLEEHKAIHAATLRLGEAARAAKNESAAGSPTT
jgi:hypothetical protein